MWKRLSPRTEFLIVSLLCFGPFAARSIVELTERKTLLLFNDRRALFILGVELVAGTLALLLLRARGWTASEFGLRISPGQTIGGVLLLLGTDMMRTILMLSAPGASAATDVQVQLTWPVLIALTAINPLYDELFGVAYVVRAAESNGAAFAITLSAAIRFICHLEQGPIAALTILPLGLLFATVYWKWRVVWPLILAHAVMDFAGLMPGVK
jgi:membrane protease YdiL (CAAX protease family)